MICSSKFSTYEAERYEVRELFHDVFSGAVYRYAKYMSASSCQQCADGLPKSCKELLEQHDCYLFGPIMEYYDETSIQDDIHSVLAVLPLPNVLVQFYGGLKSRGYSEEWINLTSELFKQWKVKKVFKVVTTVENGYFGPSDGMFIGIASRQFLTNSSVPIMDLIPRSHHVRMARSFDNADFDPTRICHKELMKNLRCFRREWRKAVIPPRYAFEKSMHRDALEEVVISDHE